MSNNVYYSRFLVLHLKGYLNCPKYSYFKALVRRSHKVLKSRKFEKSEDTP